MNITHVSASELKRNAAEILNSVYYKKNITIVEKFGKAIAKIIPIDEKENSKTNITDKLDFYFGSLPDFPKVIITRNFRQRNVSL
ncbi:hypothetical protein A2W14_05215 [Candidatus Gottesmanbacteria bacterium RBG_16_37_8]|uniref:Antitoxin n=1 Tax=Candidatus Gottesmanbacteria bacterium RBG_16_37_8 TaxID=1798371 RepID=A0A1F5YSK4_9BACT|nr:MAG: hypothetical protein A2W14_05215 [Candidatus Gottesmanbacteria bacterium RBG_16_37_8]